MSSPRFRIGPLVIGCIAILAVTAALFIALRKVPVPVDLASLSRGPMTVSIEAEGEARVRDVFVVSAPLSGRLQRLDLKAGDPVMRGRTVVARLLPGDPAFLDSRSRNQMQAQTQALAAQLASARARVAQAEAEQQLADRDVARAVTLSGKGLIAAPTLDAARMRHDRAEAALTEARAAVRAAAFQLQAAKEALVSPADIAADGGKGIAIMAPVSGTVLRVTQESEAVVTAGAPVIEIGDPAALEIEAELLSTDAVRVVPGAAVLIDKWGGERPLNGIVRRVEPSGFTKVSALGVEEQRVFVRIDITDPRKDWERLGHGYRVTVHITEWTAPDVLRIPIAALFRKGDSWATYVSEDNRAVLHLIRIGHINADEAEVTAGLKPGDAVILHPGDKVADGVRIVRRSV